MKRLPLLFLLPTLALAVYDMKWFDLNHWNAPFHNDGRWGNYILSAGASWPQPLHDYYLFGAGAWIGAVAGSSPTETLCTIFYNPNSSGTEGCPTLCRYWREGTGNSRDRIYKYPGDWPPSHSRFPMAPLWQLSDMDMWCCYCDSDPSNHDSLSRPLGVDVYQTVYGFSDSLAQDFFFLKYQLANSSGDTLRQAIFGMMLDIDIGTNTFDDKAGLILDHVYQVGQETIRVRNTGFAYDYDNYEAPGSTWESGTPGAIAVMLLSAPDSLGLTAFKQFSTDIDPLTDTEQYLTLAGYNYRTGDYEPYDSLPSPAPVDLRMLLSTGPFDIAPDSVLTFWYAVIGSPFGDSGQAPSERDTSELALRCKWAREYFEQVTGTEETMDDERVTMNVGPTIVRGILFLPSSFLTPHSSLFSLTGRKVMDLKPGTNDVSRLSPGVYFVRQASGVEREASNVTKVVLTE